MYTYVYKSVCTCSQTAKSIVQAVQEKFTAKTSMNIKDHRGISTPKATGFGATWLAREGGAPCERVPVFRWNSQADLALVSAMNGTHDTTPQHRSIHDFHGIWRSHLPDFKLVGTRFGQPESTILVGLFGGYEIKLPIPNKQHTHHEVPSNP